MFDITTITSDQLRKAQALQPEVKEFLATFPAHTGMGLIFQCALFCVLQQEEKGELQNECKQATS